MRELIKKIAYIVCAPILEDGKFSLGRWALTTCLSLALWKWAHNINITESHQILTIVFAGYVLGTKGIATIQDAVSAYKEIKTNSETK